MQFENVTFKLQGCGRGASPVTTGKMVVERQMHCDASILIHYILAACRIRLKFGIQDVALHAGTKK